MRKITRRSFLAAAAVCGAAAALTACGGSSASSTAASSVASSAAAGSAAASGDTYTIGICDGTQTSDKLTDGIHSGKELKAQKYGTKMIGITELKEMVNG